MKLETGPLNKAHQPDAWKDRLAQDLKKRELFDLVDDGIDPASKNIGETIRIVTEEIQNRINAGLSRADKRSLQSAITEQREILASKDGELYARTSWVKNRSEFEAYLSRLETMVSAVETTD